MMKKFGLIGQNISYSFSKKYFEEKFRQQGIIDSSYSLFDCENLEMALTVLQQPHLVGVNVTIPFKQKIISLLDNLSEEARAVGAVNSISIKNNQRFGYNTDVDGFEACLPKDGLLIKKNALVLGNGGAAAAVKYVLKKHGFQITTVARNSELNFDNLDGATVAENFLIVQCTPVGTFPKVHETVPFPFEALTPQHFVIDLVYNPTETKFMNKAKKLGARTMNGLTMLYAQAEKSWVIWNN